MRRGRHHTSAALVVLAALAAGLSGCFEEKTTAPRVEVQLDLIPPSTTPENVLAAIEVIYNDTVRSASERTRAYANLLSKNFTFYFQAADFPQVGRESWGREDEIAAHQAMFEKQERAEIYSLELSITHLPAEDLDPPQQGRDGWKEIFATSVFLRILTDTPEDGFEVQGGQARFLFEPSTDRARWTIGEWFDLPRP